MESRDIEKACIRQQCSEGKVARHEYDIISSQFSCCHILSVYSASYNVDPRHVRCRSFNAGLQDEVATNAGCNFTVGSFT